MVRLDEISNDKFFKSLEQQRKFIEELYAPSRAMQAQLNMATSSYFHFVQQASSVYVPALQVSQLIKDSMTSMHKSIFPTISPIDSALIVVLSISVKVSSVLKSSSEGFVISKASMSSISVMLCVGSVAFKSCNDF